METILPLTKRTGKQETVLFKLHRSFDGVESKFPLLLHKYRLYKKETLGSRNLGVWGLNVLVLRV